MPLTPVFVEKATGDQSAPSLEAEHGGPAKDTRLTEYIDFVGRRLLPFSPRRDFPHKFTVLESEDIVNAFALGNGNIYVTKGLLNLLRDEAELAEVLGHEIGHIANRHIASKIDTAIGIGGLLALAEGIYSVQRGRPISRDTQKLIDTANAVVSSLVMNGFGRSQELESDSDGLKYMIKAGYDPEGAVRTFQTFQRKFGDVKGLEIFFRSHPTASQRVSDLRARIRAKYPGVTGETFADRYQSIIFGGKTLSDWDGASGIPVAAGLAMALAIGIGIVVLSTSA